VVVECLGVQRGAGDESERLVEVREAELAVQLALAQHPAREPGQRVAQLRVGEPGRARH
jgi:hypothetical protein